MEIGTEAAQFPERNTYMGFSLQCGFFISWHYSFKGLIHTVSTVWLVFWEEKEGWQKCWQTEPCLLFWTFEILHGELCSRCGGELIWKVGGKTRNLNWKNLPSNQLLSWHLGDLFLPSLWVLFNLGEDETEIVKILWIVVLLARFLTCWHSIQWWVYNFRHFVAYRLISIWNT